MAWENGHPLTQLLQCQQALKFTPERRLTSAPKRVSILLRSIKLFGGLFVKLFMDAILTEKEGPVLDLSQKFALNRSQ
jgi:hypothetical protein